MKVNKTELEQEAVLISSYYDIITTIMKSEKEANKIMNASFLFLLGEGY